MDTNDETDRFVVHLVTNDIKSTHLSRTNFATTHLHCSITSQQARVAVIIDKTDLLQTVDTLLNDKESSEMLDRSVIRKKFNPLAMTVRHGCGFAQSHKPSVLIWPNRLTTVDIMQLLYI